MAREPADDEFHADTCPFTVTGRQHLRGLQCIGDGEAAARIMFALPLIAAPSRL